MDTVASIDMSYLASNILHSIEGSERWKSIEPVVAGWSDEAKFHIFTKTDDELLLRVGDAKRKHHNALIFAALESASVRDMHTPKPLAQGETTDGTRSYLLLSWVPGIEMGEVLPSLPMRQQYELGRKAGTLLRDIHSLKMRARPKCHVDSWYERCEKKTQNIVARYRGQDMKFELVEACIDFTERNLTLAKGRAQTFQHGDFHVGNLVLQPNGEVAAIDFCRCSFGDPWEDFHRAMWCAEVSPAFASGKVDSYFNDNVPDGFFPLLALYTAITQIGYITWAQRFASDEVETMLRQAKNIDAWYDGFTKTTPSWYASF